MAKELTIIAGPNGAGKTTFALELIDEGLVDFFINADEIAKSLTGIADNHRNIRAGRLFLQKLNQAINAQRNVCFETTLAGLSYLKLVNKLKQQGWDITLYYLALEDVSLSKLRVEERVLHGGHDIPASDIERRFPKSVFNLLNHYLEPIDNIICLLNMDSPELIFAKQNGNIQIVNKRYFNELNAIANRLNSHE